MTLVWQLHEWLASVRMGQFSLVSKNNSIVSSIKRSQKPRGRGGGSSIMGRVGDNGMSSGSRDDGGMFSSYGKLMMLGFQAEFARISLLRSIISSLRLHHADGHPAPPNDRRSCRYASFFKLGNAAYSRVAMVVCSAIGFCKIEFTA